MALRNNSSARDLYPYNSHCSVVLRQPLAVRVMPLSAESASIICAKLTDVLAGECVSIDTTAARLCDAGSSVCFVVSVRF